LRHSYRAFNNLILLHLYRIREAKNSLQKMIQYHTIQNEQEWLKTCLFMKEKIIMIIVANTCCQWVGSSSGAVDSITASSDPRLLFF
jgi:hypothetical protein